ncbi:MAG: cytochrome c oxidase accessory protein CcoG [Rhizobiaceae bacterium]|nr:cytochrome c oxidase accessory protein CcoG [Rhizobiaceae bacterium]
MNSIIIDHRTGAQPVDGLDQHDAEALNRKDKREPLFAARKAIHPKDVSGQFRNLKWIIMLVTLGIYYITPWIRWDRGPFSPDQAVLLDLQHRRFYFFFLEIWPQEFYIVAALLIMSGFGLFIMTSAAGRVWCGYSCPQTVWTDLFIKVERLIQGDRNARIALDKAPWTASKLAKRGATYAIWLLIAMATGGAWIFYFADAPTLAWQFLTFDAPPVAYATVGVLTFTTFWLGGFMREQVCTYMCPWPRIQAAMTDENSLIVTYNDWRGEPRTKGKKRSAEAGVQGGDCVDCNACVAVCPAGIDIRDGQQLECISCALCIDACDSVMDKLGRDRGLISYTTLTNYNANMQAACGANGRITPSLVHDEGGRVKTSYRYFDWQVVFRARTLLYLAVWSALGLAIVWQLANRQMIDASLIPDRNPLYVQLSDGSIQNSFAVKISNRQPTPRLFTVTVDGFIDATLASAGLDDMGGQSVLLGIDANKLRDIRVQIRHPREGITAERTPFAIVIRDLAGGETTVLEGVFNAPPELAVSN